MLLGIVFETLSIGLIMPMISVLMTKEVKSYSYLFPPGISSWLFSYSSLQLIIAFLFFMTGIYALKALFLSFLARYQTNFAYSIQARVSKQLLTAYLGQPYYFHLQKNSAQLIFNATSLPNYLASAILHGASLLTEAILILFICLLLLKVEFTGTLVAISLLAIFGYGLHKMTGKNADIWGKMYAYHEGMRIQKIQQALGGVKEVLILGRTDSLIDSYEMNNKESHKFAAFQVIAQSVSRLILEAVAIIGIMGLIALMLVSGKSTTSVIASIGLFAAAAFRLMPSANRVMQALQALRYHSSHISDLHKELFALPVVGHSSPPSIVMASHFKSSIHLEGVGYTYPGANHAALKNIDLIIMKGKSIGIIGPSGSGKSTLIDVLLGLFTPSKGKFIADGDLVQNNLLAWQRNFGYVPQSIYLSDEDLMQNIAFGIPSELINEKLIWDAIEAAQLSEFVSSLPLGLKTIVGERGCRLSGGQRQRIGIARALYHCPDILILDEATSALDSATEQEVMGAINGLQGIKTIVMVAHRLSTVSNCDWIYRLQDGVIVEQGKPSDLL
jgi:ABC-type multidrug transport system fused ATPase/permease subunit